MKLLCWLYGHKDKWIFGSEYKSYGICVRCLTHLNLMADSVIEVCICAAVKASNGKIYRGHRHSDCLYAIHARHLKPAENQHGDGQGFITSTNRYVDRIEGLKLQIAAGLKSVDPTRIDGKYGRELYSEDLY